jgi:hypothetical protein
LLAENRFLQAGNGAENTKDKSRECFTLKKHDHFVTEKLYEYSRK